MRALLISKGGIISEVNINDSIESYYEHLECDTMTSAGYPARHHAAFVDDEGLLTMKTGTFLYQVDWYPQRLAGNILVTGIDHSTGETTPATMSVQDLRSKLLSAFVITES